MSPSPLSSLAPTLMSLLLFAAPLLLPAAAQAQERSEELERMHTLNEQGFQAYERGDYRRAAALFAEAYEVHQDVNLLKNQAISYYKADDCDMALPLADEFLLAEATRSADREEARQVMIGCHLKMAERELARDRPGRATPHLASLRNERLDDTQRLTYLELSERHHAEVERSGKSRQRTVGVALVAGGALALAGTFAYRASLRDEEQELITLSEQGGDQARYDALSRKLDRARLILPLGYVAGSALMLGGGYVLLSPVLSTERSASPTNASRAGVTGAMLGYHLEF